MLFVCCVTLTAIFSSSYLAENRDRAMAESSRFHSQLASIMEVLANAAVAEICELVDDGYALLRLEISRREKENEGLRRKLHTLELRVARENAQRSAGSYVCVERAKPRGEPRCRVEMESNCAAGTSVRVHAEPQTPPSSSQAQPKEECDVILIGESSNMHSMESGFSDMDEQLIQPVSEEEQDDQNLIVQRVKTLGQSHSGPHLQPNSLTHETHAPNNLTHSVTPTVSFSTTCNSSPAHTTAASQMVGSAFAELEAAHVPNTQRTPPDQASLQIAPKELGLGSGAGSLFVCPFCGKSLASLKNLKIHVRVHTGEKPFICAQCGKRFSDSSNLKRHQSVHTGERRYRCSHCGKGFAQSGSLKVHLTIHTGQRGFRCPECGKTFISNAHLRNHQRQHHSHPGK